MPIILMVIITIGGVLLILNLSQPSEMVTSETPVSNSTNTVGLINTSTDDMEAVLIAIPLLIFIPLIYVVFKMSKM